MGDANLRPFNYRFERSKIHAGDLLVVHTDGVSGAVSALSEDLDLRRKPAVVIAQHLLENYSRVTDDALVLVLRFAPKGAI